MARRKLFIQVEKTDICPEKAFFKYTNQTSRVVKKKKKLHIEHSFTFIFCKDDLQQVEQ